MTENSALLDAVSGANPFSTSSTSCRDGFGLLLLLAFSPTGGHLGNVG